MMPDFGSNIPELAFEPLDEDLIDEVYSELMAVFDYDPRVNLVNMAVTPNFDNNSLYVNATLFYIELNEVIDFELNIQFEE
jgi:phage baseplate assembly protein W